MAWSARKNFNKQGIEAREDRGDKNPKKMSDKQRKLRRRKTKNKGKRGK
jgi:hypothetical protein